VDSRHPIAQDSKDGVILSVHVQPKAHRTECAGLYGDAVKIRIAAPPIDGAANDELIRFLADRCAIPRAGISIQAGTTGRHKRVSVKGVTAEWVLARLMPALRKGRTKV
jgi:uncharacterized protein (TIGR00251 family)